MNCRYETKIIGKAHQNHQRAWHSEIEARKARCGERSVHGGRSRLLACLLVSGKAVARAATPALLIGTGMGAVVMNYSSAVTIGNKYAIRERNDDVEIFH